MRLLSILTGWFYSLAAHLSGKNLKSTPPAVITGQLTQKRPLPVGVAEFHEWCDRIISGAMLTATPESQKFALANILINLQPTIAFETDLYFIHCLRKTAVNQVADSMRGEIRDAIKKRLLDEQNKAAVTAPTGASAEILEIQPV